MLVRILPSPTVLDIPRNKPLSILFIRPGGIGDAVLLIPAISCLRESYPESVFTVLAERRNSVVFSLLPVIDRIFIYDSPGDLWRAIRGRYDVVIDTEQWHHLSAVVARFANAGHSIGFATNERRRLFTHPLPYSHEDYEVDSFFRLLVPLGISKAENIEQPYLTVPEEAIDNARTLLGGLAEKQFVTLFPGASIPERRWGIDKFGGVAKRLHQRGISVVVVGGREDVSAGDRIIAGRYGLNLAGETSLTETAAIIGRSELLLSGDSGILHIGVGLGKPTVSLFGPGIARKWAPSGNNHIVINKCLPCSPCTKFGYTPKCRINARCMADITVDEVVKAVESLLGM
jgi:lipopolysaccharide heptosyltransferase II